VVNDIFLHGQKLGLIPESCNPMLKVKVEASSLAYVPIILTPKETSLILNTLRELTQAYRKDTTVYSDEQFKLQRSCQCS